MLKIQQVSEPHLVIESVKDCAAIFALEVSQLFHYREKMNLIHTEYLSTKHIKCVDNILGTFNTSLSITTHYIN